MTKAQHTPTPWATEHLKQDWNGDASYTMKGAGGEQLMSNPAYYPWAPDREDADFIVRAVNAHDALVEALERALIAFEYTGDGRIPYRDPASFGETYEAILAALKLAKGE